MGKDNIEMTTKLKKEVITACLRGEEETKAWGFVFKGQKKVEVKGDTASFCPAKRNGENFTSGECMDAILKRFTFVKMG